MKHFVYQPTRVVLVLLLIGTAWFLLHSSSTVKSIPILKPLSEFPKKIGSYQLSDSYQSSAGVLELLGVDDYIQYNYVSPTDGNVNLYVGFYRAVGVEGSYHSPKNCIPGGGWGIDTVSEITLKQGIDGNKQSTVSQMLIRQGSEYQVVLYWYQNRGRIIASEYWEKFYLVLDAILKGRRDGTFVRIISYSPDGNVAKTEERVKRFAEKIMPELQQYVPGAKL